MIHLIDIESFFLKITEQIEMLNVQKPVRLQIIYRYNFSKPVFVMIQIFISFSGHIVMTVSHFCLENIPLKKPNVEKGGHAFSVTKPL